jgi:hypothetical protein
MFDPRFKDFLILNNYVGIKIATIVVTRHDSKTLIPLLCSTYQKNHTFIEHPSNYGPPKTTIAMFGARSNCHGTCKFLVFSVICKF